METVYIQLNLQDDGDMVVRAQRGVRQWERHVSAGTWSALEQGAHLWNEQFERGLRPLQAPDSLVKLGEALKRECLEPFYDEMLAGETGGQLVLSSANNACLNLPWELLPVGPDFLGTCARWTLRRTTQNGALPNSTLGPGASPLRVLFMACAPVDQTGLDFEREEEAILKLTTKLSDDLYLRIVETGTFEELRQVISELKPHVVHLSGHGVVKDGTGFFCFENEQGCSDLRSAQEIGRQLFANTSVRLVFLSACQSSQAATAGLCQTLIRDGRVPLALGWSASIADDLATEFTREFYHELAAGQSVDAAIATARRYIEHHGKHQHGAIELQDASFALPQLYAAHDLNVLVDKERIDRPAMPGVRYELLGDNVRGLSDGFVGRRRELQKTRPALRGGNVRVLLLTGIGGAGKSTLTTRLANLFQLDGNGYRVVALQARKEDALGFGLRLVTEVADVCYDLGLDRHEKMLRDGERDLSDRLRLLVRVLNEAKIVLVLDNLESLLNEPPAAPTWKDTTMAAFFETLFSRLTGQGRALLTCRYLPQGFDGQLPQLEHLPLTDFAEADFFKYLRRHEGVAKRMATGELPRDLLETFQKKLGATPRFLEQACVILKTISADELEEQLDTIHLEGEDGNALARLQQKYFADLFLPRLLDALSPQAREALSRLALVELPLPLDGVARVTGLVENDANHCINEWLSFGLVQCFDELAEATLYAIYPLQRTFLSASQHLTRESAHSTHQAAAEFFQTVCERANEFESRTDIRTALEACLYHATESGDVERRLWAALHLSRFLLLQSELRAALKLAEYLLREVRSPELLKSASDALVRLGEWKRAREYCEEALGIHNDQDALRISLLHCLATIDMSEGDNVSARHGFDEALSIQQRIGGQVNEAAIRHSIASIDLKQGKYNEARNGFKKVLSIIEETDDYAGIAATLHQIATIDMREGNYDGALGGFYNALSIRQYVGDRLGESTTLHQVATVEISKKNYFKAREVSRKALSIRQDIGDLSGEAISLAQLATIDMEEGDHIKAREGFEKALLLQRSIGDFPGEATTLHHLAVNYRNEGKLVQARSGFERSIAAYQSLGDQLHEALAWYLLASIDITEEKYNEANVKLTNALAISQAIGDQVGEATTFHQIGVAAWKSQRQHIGIRLIAVSFAVLESTGSAEQQIWNNLTSMATELGLEQEGFAAMCMEAIESYKRDRGAELVRRAFED